MKNYRFALTGLFGLTLLALPIIPTNLAYAQTSEGYQTPAANLLILDYETGEVLFEKNAREPMFPASMTKIMTASVVFDRIKSGALSLDDEFTVSEDAWRRGGTSSGSSTMFLKLNSKVSVRDLLFGVIVQSGNDACIVLAQNIAGSEAAFADMMNAKAKELGLTTANFVNSTGWPHPDHKISAYDLAKLARNTISQYPELYKIYAERSFTWNGIKQPNRNPLFGAGIGGVDGLKTGHTKISKYGFVGSGALNGVRRIFVINGLETNSARRSESRRTMRSAFGEFKTYKVFDAGQKAGSAKVFMGKAETVSLMTNENVIVGLHKSLRAKLKAEVVYQGPIPTPVAKGDHIADLVITAPGRETETVALYAGEDVARKSIFGRMSAGLMRKIRGQ